MDSKVFKELQNRGVITVVGLDPAKYEDMSDLQRCQLATAIGAVEDYNEIVGDDQTEVPTVEEPTQETPVVESTVEPTVEPVVEVPAVEPAVEPTVEPIVEETKKK